MLEDRVLYYYRNDYNCAQCMLMGARDEYGLPIECCCVDMCAGVYNGLVVESICSIVVGGVMVISLYFKNENTIKHKRMEFINNIYEKFNTINCGKMPKQNGCDNIVYEGAKILRIVIESG